MYEVHLFQYKSQYNTAFNVNSGNQGVTASVLVATYNNCLFIPGVFTPATNFCSLYARSCDKSFTLFHCRYELEVSFSGLDTGLPPKIG
jgi:hypothetical protein